MDAGLDIEAMQDIYSSLINLIGKENTILLWQNYKGVQLSLPAHLYNREKVSELIRQQEGPIDARAWAVKYGYSEKWVRQILRQQQRDKA